MTDESQRCAARVFAITFLLTLLIITFAFLRFYAPFLVWNNAAETARNLIAHQSVFRLYIVAAFIYGVGIVVMLAALYVVLRPISRGIALFAACSWLVYVASWFVMLLDILSALRIMGGGEYLRVFEPERLQALAGLQLASGQDAYYIGLAFYGLGLLLFSWLWFKSIYVPRTLAAMGVLSSVFEGLCGFAYLIYPSFGTVISVNWYEAPTTLFGVAISCWILVKGLMPPPIASSIQVTS